MTKKHDTALRQSIIDGCLWMKESGLNQGTSGNISVRAGEGMLITPSGIPYDRMRPDMLCEMSLTEEADMSGNIRPSTEWRFHQSILRSNPAVTAVVHAHPAHASALAVQHRTIPACHYMVAAFGGTDVPLVGYSLFGSVELAEGVAAAMKTRSACLMANHGAIATGDTLDRALWRMEELENLSRVYLLALSTGTPTILTDAQMNDVIDAFAGYGPKSDVL